jgi:hypothetical protein
MTDGSTNERKENRMTTSHNRTINFTGTIVSIEIRTPKEKTRTVLRYNSLAGKRVPTEVTHQGKEYAVLKIRSKKTGNVQRCIAWDVEDLAKRPIRWANVGDQVQITGTPEVITLKKDDGTPFDLHQVVITGYKVLKKHPRRAA